MANQITTTILIDDKKHVVVRVTGVYDSPSAATNTMILTAQTLSNSKNANGFVTQTDPRGIYRLALDKAKWNIKGGVIKLEHVADTSANGPNVAMLVMSGTGQYNEHKDETFGKIQNPFTAATSNGDIAITTIGFTTNDSFTLIADFAKNPNDYDNGSTGYHG